MRCAVPIDNNGWEVTREVFIKGAVLWELFVSRNCVGSCQQSRVYIIYRGLAILKQSLHPVLIMPHSRYWQEKMSSLTQFCTTCSIL